jgi:hypothetical protein
MRGERGGFGYVVVVVWGESDVKWDSVWAASRQGVLRCSVVPSRLYEQNRRAGKKMKAVER